MERIPNRRPSGYHNGTLRTWGLLFLAAGIIGKSILQNRMLGTGSISTAELLEVMSSSDSAMGIATAALLLQAIETLAVPIFAFMLVEGYQHTSSFKNYLLRVLGLAVLSELPYNFAMGGKILDLSTRNPVFGMALGLILLYFYTLCAEKSWKNTLIKAVVTVSAVLWTEMLRIENGAAIIVLVAVLWGFRAKPNLRTVAGATAAIVCSLISPFYMVSAMGFLVIHGYNGEEGNSSQQVNYLAYPVMLLVIGLVGMVLV